MGSRKKVFVCLFVCLFVYTNSIGSTMLRQWLKSVGTQQVLLEIHKFDWFSHNHAHMLLLKGKTILDFLAKKYIKLWVLAYYSLGSTKTTRQRPHFTEQWPTLLQLVDYSLIENKGKASI